MGQLINVEVEELIKLKQSSPQFNNELLVISLNGSVNIKSNDRVQINGFSLILMLEGELDININGTDHHISSRAFLDVIDVHAVQNIKMSADFRGYHVIVKHSFMDETMRGVKRMPIGNFIPRFECPIMQLNQDEASVFEKIILDMVKSIARTEHVYRRDLVKNNLRGMMLEVSNIIILKGRKYDPGKFQTKDDIIAQFIVMVNKNCRTEHGVSFYARELCVEPKYLSRILKNLNGKTANKWIDDAIVVKARMMLKDSELTLQQIADMLHFSDQSSFGKFFKKNCGVSPLSYRRS